MSNLSTVFELTEDLSKGHSEVGFAEAAELLNERGQPAILTGLVVRRRKRARIQGASGAFQQAHPRGPACVFDSASRLGIIFLFAKS
jgi:hypothetical protein